MHDRLFANQQQLQPEALGKHAEALGLDVQACQACLDSSQYTAKIHESLKDGQTIGVTGTPAFLLGSTQGDGAEVKAVTCLIGALPFDTCKANIVAGPDPPRTPVSSSRVEAVGAVRTGPTPAAAPTAHGRGRARGPGTRAPAGLPRRGPGGWPRDTLH